MGGPTPFQNHEIKGMMMNNYRKMAFAGCTALALVLSLGAPAFAGSAMCADKAAMAKDAMMKDDGMAKDAMMKDDGMKKDMAMADDKMTKDTMMKDDAMKKDMAMADDKMAKDGMAKDAMMKDDKAGMMMAEYTVKPGDSLWSIAESELCDGAKYPEIVSANADMLSGGKTVHPGQVLHIPGD